MKKIFIVLLVVVFISTSAYAASFPTTGIIDNFNRVDEGPPPSASWTAFNANGLGVKSNQCYVTNAPNTAQAYWNASTYGANEEVYFTIATANSTDASALRLKFDVPKNSGYRYRVSAGTSDVRLQRVDNGTIVTLSTIAQAVSDGDKFGASYINGTFTAWYNHGAGWTVLGSVYDNAYATQTGSLMLEVNDAGTTTRVDDFGGGTLPNKDAIANARINNARIN